MATMSEIMVNLSMDMKDFNRQMNEVSKKTKKLGSKMTSAGSSMTKNLSVPIALVGGAVVKMGSDFEATMSKVEAITGSNGQEMDKLSEKAKDLGSTTKYSASEVAEGMTYLGMAGMKNEQILASMGGMLDLASAGSLDLAQASDIATNIMSGFGMEAKESGRMADVLAYASSNANTNVQEMGEAMKPLAPMANSLGWSMEESASAVMALADAGIKGEMAGSSFATSLGRLTKPTKQMREKMAELGLEFFDAQGNMKPMADVIGMLEKKTKGMTKEQKANTLTTLFGAESYKHWATLLNKGSGELDKNTEALENSKGSAKKMADTMSNNLQGSFKEFKSAIEGTAISLYEILAPSLKVIVAKLTEAVRWFNGLSDSTKATIGKVALVVAGLGVLITIIGSAVIFIGSMVTAFGSIIGVIGTTLGVLSKLRTALSLAKILPLVTSPIGIIVLAIAGLIAIGILIWKNWDTIKAKAIEIWGAISNWFTSVWTSISEKASEIWGGIKTYFTNTWTSIKDSVSNFLTSLATKFTDGWNSIKTKTAEVFNSIVDFMVEWGLRLFNMTPIGMIVNLIIDNWKLIKDTTKIIFDMIVALIKVAFVLIMKVVTPIVNGIKKLIEVSWNFIKDTTSAVFNKVKEVFTRIWNSIVNFFEPIIEGIVKFLVQRWENLKNNTQKIFNAVKSVLTTVWNTIKSVVTTIATAIWTAVRDKFTAMYNSVSSTVSDIWNKVSSKFTSMYNKVKSVAGDIWSTVKDKFNKVKSAITDPIKKAKDTISGYIDDIKGFFSGMKLEIPKPKVPKVSVSTGTKRIAGIDVPYPKFSLHAKGGIFNGASMLGGNNIVGEAGSEVVMPVQHKRYMKPFANAVADNMEEMSNGGNGSITNKIEVAELVVREEADIEKVAQKLYEIQQRGKRQGGRR